MFVIARSGATAGKSYVHRSFGERAVFAGYLIVFSQGHRRCCPVLLELFCKTPDYWQQLNSHKRAVAQPNVNAKELGSFVLPVPPLVDQDRIVKLLDEVDQLRKLRVKSDQRRAKLIPAFFHGMFGDPVKNPFGWPLMHAGTLMEACDYGTSKKANEAGRGIPVLRMGNVTIAGDLDVQDLKTVELEGGELGKAAIAGGRCSFQSHEQSRTRRQNRNVGWAL